MLGGTLGRDFASALRSQLGFIRRSIELFDRGHRDEALRIATAIRVILHDTNSSTSLLTHMGAREVPLLSTCRGGGDIENEEARGETTYYYFGLGVVKIGGPGVRYDATVAGAFSQRHLPADEWWREIVWVLEPGMKLRRRDIVLAAANKDGGAHVDEELPEGYVGLIEAPFRIEMSTPGRERPQDVHLAALRLIGEEVVSSKDLEALAS